jgi:hypothetical protein
MRHFISILFLGCWVGCCASAQTPAPGTHRLGPLPVRSTVVNVKDFGARGDGVTDDTIAIQSAIDLSFGPALTPHGSNYVLNRPLYFPAGHYIVSSPLMFTQLQGGQITGDGRFSTTIDNTTGTGVIATNGCSYTHWEGLALQGTGSATIFDLNWDNSPGGDALQSNTFQEMSFSGGAIGVNVGGGGFMGSENLFLNCKWIWQSVAGLKTSNYNALQNTIVGGNISNTAVGVWMYEGTVSTYNVGFQQQTNWDIKQDNSANAAIVISGSRTESANFFSGGANMNVKIEGISQDTTVSGVFVSHNGPISIEACHSVNGQVMGSAIGNIQSSTFGREDWLQPNSRTNLNLSGISVPSGYINQATASASGLSYPLQRTTIPIPQNEGIASIPVKAGTYLQRIVLIVSSGGLPGTISVGDDSGGSTFLDRVELKGGTTERSVATYYATDDHIRVSCTRAKGAAGFLVVEFQQLATAP